MNRKFIIITILWASLLVASQALAVTKIDPYFSAAKTTTSLKAMKLSSTSDQAKVEESDVSVFIKSVDADKTSSSIRSAGGQVHTIIGDIITASLSPSSLQSIANGRKYVFVRLGNQSNHPTMLLAQRYRLGKLTRELNFQLDIR